MPTNNNNNNNNNKRPSAQRKSVVKRKDYDSLGEDNYTDKKSKMKKIYIAIGATVLIILLVFIWSLQDKKKESSFEDIVDTTKEIDKKEIEKQNKELKKELDMNIPNETQIRELEALYLKKNPDADDDYLKNYDFYEFVTEYENLTEEETDLFIVLYSSDTYIKNADSAEDKKMKTDAMKWYVDNKSLVSKTSTADMEKFSSKLNKSLVYDAPSVIDTQVNTFTPIGDYFTYTVGFTETENVTNLYRGFPIIDTLEEGLSRITVHYIAKGKVTTADFEEEAAISLPKIDGISSRGYNTVFPKEKYAKLPVDVQKCVYGEYVVVECNDKLGEEMKKLEESNKYDKESDEYVLELTNIMQSDANILHAFTGSVAKEELVNRKHSEFINYDINVGKELYQGVVYKAVYYIKTADIKLPQFKMNIGENVYEMADIQNNTPLETGIDFNWS